ncbi:hypothetical protein MXB_5468 [Myxobolus squamalis]|nr:hypothetical protein MXB_5468 [Myxobolus squamalis]
MVGKGIIKPDFSIILDNVNKNLVKLCKKCIGFNPDSRPMFNEVTSLIYHKIVSGILNTFYFVPIIEKTTSCLQLNDDTTLNMSHSSINMVNNSYLIPSYINNLKEAYSAHDIGKKIR